MSAAIEALAARLGPAARRHVALAPLTTYGVGGPADLLVEVPEEASLLALAQHRHEVLEQHGAESVPVLVVGLGSNLLIGDEGFAGLVVVLGAGFAGIEIEGRRVRAGARAKLPVVARQAATAGLAGFEWAAGVPGTIGGAVRMNAGVPEVDLARHLVGVRVVDLSSGKDGAMSAADLDLGYRTSSLRSDQVVTWADLELEPGDPEAGRAAIKEKTQWRRDHQPGGRNAGSVFTNPPGDSAGRLIDEAGCKGLRIGTAVVSEKHANFILSDAGGSAADVWAVIAEVRRRVFARSGIMLHAENLLVGLPELPEPDGGGS